MLRRWLSLGLAVFLLTAGLFGCKKKVDVDQEVEEAIKNAPSTGEQQEPPAGGGQLPMPGSKSSG